MELMKNSGSDLKKWSAAFTNLVLVVSISALLVAFEWKAYDDFQLKDFSSSSEIWDMTEIPITIQTPPPPPEQAPEITIKPNDELLDKIEMIIAIDVPINAPLPAIELTGPPILDNPDEIKDFVEKQALFKRGMEAWYGVPKEESNLSKSGQRDGYPRNVDYPLRNQYRWIHSGY
jgi:protein TonB